MDAEIQELKRMVARSLEISEDTNRIVHGMRNSARWDTFFKVLYWLFILGALGASYVFIMPYLTQLQSVYNGLQSTISTTGQTASEAQSLLQQFSQFIPKQ